MKKCVSCEKSISRRAIICPECQAWQKRVKCHWCRSLIASNLHECPHCATKREIKPPRKFSMEKHALMGLIFTLAALLPVACWLIIGKDGLTTGAVIGGVFALIGFFVAMILSD